MVARATRDRHWGEKGACQEMGAVGVAQRILRFSSGTDVSEAQRVNIRIFHIELKANRPAR